MNHNSSSFQAALQVAYQSPLAHLENLGNRPVAATAGLSELRSKLAKPLNDHSLDPEEVVRIPPRHAGRDSRERGRTILCMGDRRLPAGGTGGGLADLGMGSECRSICK